MLCGRQLGCGHCALARIEVTSVQVLGNDERLGRPVAVPLGDFRLDTQLETGFPTMPAVEYGPIVDNDRLALVGEQAREAGPVRVL